MTPHRLALYYAWSRPEEVSAPLQSIDDRFPALFETRRIAYPRFRQFADPAVFDQGIAGFLDHVMKRNFTAFVEDVRALTGRCVPELERVDASGRLTALDSDLVDGLDTLVVIGFDSPHSSHPVDPEELRALRAFLGRPGTLLVVCPHHDIGRADDLPPDDRDALQEDEFLHHGDRSIPPQQRFGGFARALLAGLGLPVDNRYGLRPAAAADGSPAAIVADRAADRLGLLVGVDTFNLHAHLPHFERRTDAMARMEVLASQHIDPHAPAHPFTQGGRWTFDAMLQSRAGVFAGDVVVCDATLWSSTAGGVESLRRLWANLAMRPITP